MVLRLSAALFTALCQGFIFWSALYFAVRYINGADTRHHHGVGYGLMIYYLLICTWLLIGFVNLTSAIVNYKWFTWLIIVFGIDAVFQLMPADIEHNPFRVLFYGVVVVPLFCSTVMLNTFFSRMLVKAGRLRKQSSFT